MSDVNRPTCCLLPASCSQAGGGGLAKHPGRQHPGTLKTCKDIRPDRCCCSLLPAAKLAEVDLQCTLAVSIHAGNQALRERLIPRCAQAAKLPWGPARLQV